jgi:anti-sigma-K factor RskA
MAEQSSQRSRSQIEADLAATRTRLSATLEELIGQVHPKAVKQRQISNVKTLMRGEINNAKSKVQSETGEWRFDRIAMIAGSVVGTVVVVVVLRTIVRRGKAKGELTK